MAEGGSTDDEDASGRVGCTRVAGGKGEREHGLRKLDKAVGDLTMVAFYYLLRVGEYTIKGTRNETKQTVQFKLEDVTFFKKNSTVGKLYVACRENAPDHMIMTADGATLKLDNQKNGWKGVCVYHETNGDPDTLPCACALGRRVRHIRNGKWAWKDISLCVLCWNPEVRRDCGERKPGIERGGTGIVYPAAKGHTN